MSQGTGDSDLLSVIASNIAVMMAVWDSVALIDPHGRITGARGMRWAENRITFYKLELDKKSTRGLLLKAWASHVCDKVNRISKTKFKTVSCITAKVRIHKREFSLFWISTA